jgi:hypothetical protein
LPSGAFLAIVAPVLCVGLVAGLFYLYGEGKDVDQNTPAQVAQSQLALQERIATEDSDGDGLADWEEVLWNTDVNNPDTDGDGVPDGDDLDLNSDLYATGTNTEHTSSTTGPTALTATDRVGREIFGTYLAYKEIGGISPEERTELIDRIINRSAQLIQPDTYTVDDLKLVDGYTTTEYAAYKAALDDAFLPARAFRYHELLLLAVVMEKKEEGAHQELVQLNIAQKQIRENLLTMDVPRDAAETHLELVNTLSHFLFNVEGLLVVHTDPIRTMLSTRDFLDVEHDLVQARLAAVSYANARASL